MNTRITELQGDRLAGDGPQPIGLILAELLAQYQIRFPRPKSASSRRPRPQWSWRIVMLVLARRKGEVVEIDGQIKVTVLQIQGGHVRLGIEAPREIGVRRADLSPARPARRNWPWREKVGWAEQTVNLVGLLFRDPVPAKPDAQQHVGPVCEAHQ